MTTQADMIAEIESDSDRSDSAALRLKIGASIRYYQRLRFYFNEGRETTFSLVVGQTDYSVTDVGKEFYRVDAVYIEETAGEFREVKRRDYRWSETLEGNVTNNLPYSYGFIDRTFRFYPPPDQTYTVRIAGHEKAAAPASDDEADNVWMNEAYDLIKSDATARWLAERWQDPQTAMVHQAIAGEQLRNLRKATFDKIGTGEIRPTQF